MGRVSQERMTGKTYAERKAHGGGFFSRAVRAFKKVHRELVEGKPHPYGVGNASRDGVPRKRDGLPAISLKKAEEP